jgi:hypothetical protein
MVYRSVLVVLFAGLVVHVSGCAPAPPQSLDGAEESKSSSPARDAPLVEGKQADPVASASASASAPLSPPGPPVAAGGVDAVLSALGGSTWTGTYTGQKPVGRCFANNAGNLTMTLTQGGDGLSSKVVMTGIDLRDTAVCSTAGTANGSSQDERVQVTGRTITGAWTVEVPGPTQQFSYPFIGTIAGTTMTGTWRCVGCSGGFTLTKQ